MDDTDSRSNNPHLRGRISRRAFIRRAALLGATAAAAQGLGAACAPIAAPPTAAPAAPTPVAGATVAAAGAPAATSAPPSAGGTKGGMLRVATIGEPPSLDLHWTTTVISRTIMEHVYEGLFTFDDKLAVIPQLAEKYEVGQNGLQHTMRLRKGVQFHNGKEMTSEDVEASLKRWGNVSPTGKELFAYLESMASPDKYTVVLKLKRAYSIVDATLSLQGQGAAIYPKEVVEEAGTGQIKQNIGTGPYKFVEHQKDRFLRMTRFDGYANFGDKPNGLGGKKFAYFDELRFIPVPDQSVRLAGIQSGDYDLADGINLDQYTLLKDNKQVKSWIFPPTRQPYIGFNHQQPAGKNAKLRQAMWACVDCEAVMKAAYGSTEFYRLNPALMQKEQVWYSEAGAKNYNLKNPDKAKQLLKESGYNGDPIIWLSTKEYPTIYQESVVASQAMQAVGINVKLDVVDWATATTRRNKPDGWDIYHSFQTIRVDPLLMPWLRFGAPPNMWADDKASAMRDDLQQKYDFKERFAIWEKFQEYFWEQVPMWKFGDAKEFLISSPKVMDIAYGMNLTLWNAYFAK